MTREQYITFRKHSMIDNIMFYYLKENYDLLLDFDEYAQKIQLVNILLQQQQFNKQMMIEELDVKYELTFVENIQTKQIYDII